jgi:hypothetical protein
MNHESNGPNGTPYFSIGSNLLHKPDTHNSMTVYSDREMNTLFEEPYHEDEPYQSGEYQSSIHIQEELPQQIFSI